MNKQLLSDGRKPLTMVELKSAIKELKDPNYDPETMHGVYEDILERYCLRPSPRLAHEIEKLITKVRPKVNFWYA